MHCLQFQDITNQQLNYASSVLNDMEARLTQLARIFDPDQLGLAAGTLDVAAMTTHAFDPAATTVDAVTRQALVDEIFSS
jgi:hypothetical protein